MFKPDKHESLDLSAYRKEVKAAQMKAAGTQRALLGLLNRQLRNLEREPDNAALRELTMGTVRRLAATD